MVYATNCTTKERKQFSGQLSIDRKKKLGYADITAYFSYPKVLINTR
jgi:hypothetical protein